MLSVAWFKNSARNPAYLIVDRMRPRMVNKCGNDSDDNDVVAIMINTALATPIGMAKVVMIVTAEHAKGKAKTLSTGKLGSLWG